jgi:hypothetical protein
MIFWALIASAAVLFGISARQNDFRVSRAMEIRATDKPDISIYAGKANR